MNKGYKTKFEKIIKVAVPLIVITIVIFSIHYYKDHEYSFFYKVLFSINNTLSVFAFKPNISIQSFVDKFGNKDVFAKFISYLYALVVNVAPLLTIACFYKLFQKLFNIGSWLSPLLLRNRERIYVIGFNDIVKNWCKKNENKNVIVIVNDDIEDAKLNVLVDTKTLFLKKNEDSAKYNYIQFLRRQGITKKDRIVIFDENNNIENANILIRLDSEKIIKAGMNVDIFTNSRHVHELIEVYNDDRVKSKSDKKYRYNIEIFDYKDLVVQRALTENKLYSCYNESTIDPDEMHIHVLILGFGDYGLAYLKNIMNLAVLSANNKVLIDVFDVAVNQVKTSINDNFSNSYVKNANSKSVSNRCNCKYMWKIDNLSADGEFVIRLHDVDCTTDKLKEKFVEVFEDMPINNIIIALKDMNQIYDAFLKLIKETKKDKDCFKEKSKINIFVKMTNERDGETYKKINSHLYAVENLYNVKYNFIPFGSTDISIMDVLENNKKYINPYEYYDAESLIQILYPKDDERTEKKVWNDNDIYNKESTIARAQSIVYAEWVLEMYAKYKWNICDKREIYKKVCDALLNSKIFVDFDKNKDIFRCNGNSDVIVGRIDNNSFVKDFIAKEHRRWCYYLASKGWGDSDSEKYAEYNKMYLNDKTDENKKLKEKYRKNNLLKKHICLCDYEKLKEIGGEDCIKDIKPLLYIIKKNLK